MPQLQHGINRHRFPDSSSSISNSFHSKTFFSEKMHLEFIQFKRRAFFGKKAKMHQKQILARASGKGEAAAGAGFNFVRFNRTHAKRRMAALIDKDVTGSPCACLSPFSTDDYLVETWRTFRGGAGPEVRAYYKRPPAMSKDTFEVEKLISKFFLLKDSHFLVAVLLV